jgi:putative DNA primase/helicase
MKPIPFDHVVPKSEQDGDLPEKLRNAAPAILAWAVEGCLLWQAEGLQEPAVMLEALADYRAAQDPLSVFLDEVCERGTGMHVVGNDIHRAYQTWQLQNAGEMQELSMTALYKELEGHGLKSKRSNGKKTVYGVALKPLPAATVANVRSTYHAPASPAFDPDEDLPF